MAKPEGYVEQVFKSTNTFFNKCKWKVEGRAITAVDTDESESSGMCFALTCNWFKHVFQLGIENSNKVMSQHELLMVSIVQSGYMSGDHESNPFDSRMFTGADKSQESQTIVYRQFGFKTDWTERVEKNEGADKFTKKVENSACKQSLGPLFFEVFTPKHTMGLVWDLSQTAMYFFNPNWGCFKYLVSNIDKIVEHVRNLKSCQEANGTVKFKYLIPS